MKRLFYLLSLLFGSFIMVHAQTSQSTMSYDTLGNRTQRIIAPVTPSREGERGGQGEEGQKKRDKELIPRKYIPSDYETADIREFLPARKRESLRTDPSLPVAAIPYQATVTPSGGRVYSVPIRTAAGFEYVPQISLTYNSQGGPGTAGWGWEIGGLSSITLRGKTLYYDGVKAPVSRVDSLAAYAIDGIPLVPNGNPDMSADYPLESAQGHIQVRRNADGTFTALYPDGRLAVYGVANDTRPRVEWPLCYTNDAKGNIIYCAYDYYGNDNTISAIYYGYGADPAGAAGRIEFHYSIRPDSLSRYVAGLDVHKTRILKNVLSFDRADTMCIYSLTHNVEDGVSRAQSLDFWSHGQRINPLIFESKDPVPIPNMDSIGRVGMPPSFYSEDIILKRGKFIKGSFYDGILAYQKYENYAPDDGNAHNWSAYPVNAQIFLSQMDREHIFNNPLLRTGPGFQTADAADIDGDGADEIIKICYGSNCDRDGIDLIITAYKDNDTHTCDSLVSTLNVPGTNGPMVGTGFIPQSRLFFYGDFSGRGKTELLSLTYQYELHSRPDSTGFALINNIDTGAVLESSGKLPFCFDWLNINSVQVLDIDADGITEICYCRRNSAIFEIYKYNTSLNKFVLNKTATGFRGSYLASEFCISDVNADGYPDFLTIPTIGGDQSDVWGVFEFTGEKFIEHRMRIRNLYEQPFMPHQFMMMDVDRDGWQDMICIRGEKCYLHRNINGTLQNSQQSSRCDSVFIFSSSIIPPNKINYLGASTFMVAGAYYFYLYEYNDPAPPKHQIRTFYDSYENRIVDYHADLSEHHVCSLDEERSYDASQGYFRETMPLQVLEASVTYMPNGTPATYSTQVSHDLYRYKDPVINSRGLGFCGFGEVKVIHKATSNEATGFTDFTRMVNDPEKRGVVTERHTPGSAVFNTYDDHTDIYGYLSPRLMTSVERDSLNATVTTTNVWSYDRFDLPTSSSVSHARPLYSGDESSGTWIYEQDILFEQWRDSTVTTYAHKYSPQKFAIGLPTETRQIRIHPTKGQWTRRTTVVYDTLGTGAMFLPLEIREYTGTDGDQLVSTTTRTYSPPNFSGGFPGGRVLTEQTRAYNATACTQRTYTYSTDSSFPGRYLESETDPLGRTTTYSNYDYFGNPRTVTDHKNRSTTYTYDIWGNLTSRTDIDGTVTTVSRAWASENGDRPAAKNALIKTTTSVPGHPTAVTYTDALGREVKSGEMRMDGRYMYVSTEYDKRGNISRKSLPYKTTYDSQVLWNTYTYDDYGRPTLSQEASGIRSTVSYPTAVRADGPGQPSEQSQDTDQWQTGVTTVKENVTSTKAYDVMGGLLQASDAGGTIRYSYRPDGQLDTLTAPGGYLTVFTYDSFGRRTSISDPSVGTRSSSETWANDGTCTRTETNDKGSITTVYDLYGRKTSVTRTGPGAFNTSYTYDSDDGALLTAVTSTNGTSQEYTYDEYDRPRAERFYAPDSRAFVRVSNYATSTDGGRLSSYQYVSLGTSLYTETIRYTNGCYTGVGTGNNPDIKITSENDMGLPTAMNTDFSDTRYYSYDIYGRQTERTVAGFILPNPDRDTLQRFTYQYGSTDAHNITRRGEQVNGTQEIFLYDNLDRLKGDLTTRTTYDSLGNIRSINFKSQQYDDPLHPYRQTGGSVDGSFSRSQQIVYTAFDRPHTIREGNRVATFTYNDSHQRVKMEMADTLGNVIYTRYYLGGCWELDVAGTTTTERLYVGGDYYSAPLVKERKKTGNNWPIINTYSLCRDIIGSVTYIPNGNSPYEYSYNVWGRSRDPGTLTPDAFGTDPGFRFHRGWGGHEYLPEFGLYNCNARLYDPLYGRFLSPDPYVQAPDFTQNLNRYSYALNNPLKYTDESGELIWEMVLVSSLMSGFINWGINGASFSWSGVKYFSVGALSAVLSSLSGGLTSVAIGAAGFWGGFVSSSVSGFVSSFIQNTGNSLIEGLNFKDAARSAMVGSAVGAMIGGLKGGMMSGIDALSHNGNFWNGIGTIIDYKVDYSAMKNNADPVEYSNASAKDFSDRNFGPVKTVRELYSDGTLLDGYYYDTKGVRNASGEYVLGSTRYLGEGLSDVYLYEGAFSSKQQLYLVMGHEYYHSYLNAIGIPSGAQHSIIHDWQYRQALEWNYRTEINSRDYWKYNPTGQTKHLGLQNMIRILNRWTNL